MEDITNIPVPSATKPLPPSKPEMDEETLKMLNGGGIGGSFSGGGGSGGGKAESLQERFARFRKERKRERKLAKFVAQSSNSIASAEGSAAAQGAAQRTPESRDALRSKFVRTAKKYLGVPYARSYHPTPDCEHYDAPLYLDCCGLVRRALQDLAPEFGFRVGRWNQNYQFDTLDRAENPPLTFEQLKPGDLVFVEGRYFNEKAKRQKYDLVHVEIFLGHEIEGEGMELSTIGARHQRGVCKVHESYQYTSKSYEILKYHFRSIEPWLRGELEPAHPDHWQSRDKDIAGGAFGVVDAAGKRSIFDDDDDDDDGNVNAGGVDDDAIDDDDAASSSAAASGAEKQKGKKPVDTRPVFYVENGNGWKLVSAALEKFGWARLPFEYGFRSNFQLKWVQTRAQIDYVAFKEGNQLVNHIPNNTVLTSKLGLLETLREHFGEAHFPPAWFPESYRLDVPSDGLRLLARHDELLKQQQQQPEDSGAQDERVIWILKPSGANCGRGIRLVDDAAELRRECFPDTAPAAATEQNNEDGEVTATAEEEDQEEGGGKKKGGAGERELGGMDLLSSATMPNNNTTKKKAGPRHEPTLSAAVAQRYLSRPLLLGGGRKFDLRVYFLVARASPGQLLAYVHHGYARLSLEEYSLDSLDDR